jgi:hypothetical protein
METTEIVCRLLGIIRRLVLHGVTPSNAERVENIVEEMEEIL